MAKREFSSTLQNLKFMQRAQQKEEALKKAEDEAAAVDDSHWIASTSLSSPGRKCIVIMEGDPKPGALVGRMSFQNCNATIDKLNEEAESLLKRRFTTAKERVECTSASKTETSIKQRDESNSEQQSVVKLSSEESKDVQNKKPRVTGADGSLQQSKQSQQRNDNKTWQGWRGKGDFRVLKPHVKQ